MPSRGEGARRDCDPVDLAILATLARVPNASFDVPPLAAHSLVPLPARRARLPALERGRYVVRMRDGAAPAGRSYLVAPAGRSYLVRP